MRLLAGGTEHCERLVSPHEGGVLKVWRGGGVREEGKMEMGEKQRKKGGKGGRERKEGEEGFSNVDGCTSSAFIACSKCTLLWKVYKLVWGEGLGDKATLKVWLVLDQYTNS